MAVHRCNAHHHVQNLNGQHYIQIDAEWGTTQESAYYSKSGKLVSLNNSNNIGFIGYGYELSGSTIVIKTNAENNTPNLYNVEDRIFVKYSINDQLNLAEVYVYDKDEDEDDYPTIKLTINFL